MNARPLTTAAAALALALALATSPSTLADPLVPLTSDEVAYLDHARLVFAEKHDPVAFRSDGELLELGRYVCAKRTAGFVGTEATLTSPAVTQLALIHLCP